MVLCGLLHNPSESGVVHPTHYLPFAGWLLGLVFCTEDGYSTFPETSVNIHLPTWRHIPEDSILQSDC
ncbi:hypothetical protein B7P43_G14419 [Cryptotermes secundus]|uniref:Uncharacterized protein n=1 Tax=Cryptotermes secundus TaxID=105785 RepID=A0A2J7RKM2_9NEOP|nr:hypothetical protein B7P43_G14419 [Cryptotermes secundus]